MREFPYGKAGVIVEGLPYSAWSLIEHLRISQDDIVEFSRNPEYTSPAWPEEYWPDDPVPESEAEWNRGVAGFRAGLDRMIELVLDEQRDLLAPFPWGDGQNLLREAVMLAEHNAYHGGQIVVIGRLLGVGS